MKKADELLDRYHSGKATPEEKAIVESWYLKYKTGASDLKHEVLLEDYEKGRKQLHQIIKYKEQQIVKLWPRVAVAALLLAFLAIGFYFFNTDTKHAEQQQIVSETLLQPNTVTLTLADGRKVNLLDKNEGEIAQEKGLKINQTANGQLVYTILDEGKDDKQNSYNIIETPIGSQYAVVLPDGSKIWLSSASKLRYPTHFSDRERRVELVGEAYFEVKSIYRKDEQSQYKKIPFIVLAGNQEVEVLGTQFNISAYNDDDAIKTALLEGSVKVSLKKAGKSSSILLKPGQMATNKSDGSDIKITNVDVEDVRAWREGYFIFNNENIGEIMKKLARWYGFETEYVGNMSDVEFQGNYLRTRDLSNLLKTMEMTNKVKFKVVQNNKERKVIVIRNE